MNSHISHSGSIQLSMVPQAQITTMTYSNGQQVRGIFIPIDGNPVISTGKNDPNKIMLNLTVFQYEQVDKYGQTHYVRTNCNMEASKVLSREQQNACSPIVGNIKPIKTKQQQAYAPQGGYAPQPMQGGYAPQPAQGGYAPQPAQTPMGASAPQFTPNNPGTPYTGQAPMPQNQPVDDLPVGPMPRRL